MAGEESANEMGNTADLLRLRQNRSYLTDARSRSVANDLSTV